MLLLLGAAIIISLQQCSATIHFESIDLVASGSAPKNSDEGISDWSTYKVRFSKVFDSGFIYIITCTQLLFFQTKPMKEYQTLNG